MLLLTLRPLKVANKRTRFHRCSPQVCQTLNRTYKPAKYLLEPDMSLVRRAGIRFTVVLCQNLFSMVCRLHV